QNIDFKEIGIKTAKLFSRRTDKMEVYEKAAAFMFNELISVVGHIRLYLIDEKEEVFKEELVYTSDGFESGYDFIPFYQLQDRLMKDLKHIKHYDNDILNLLLPLAVDKRIIGLMSLKIVTRVDEEDIASIRDMTDAISMGLFHSLHYEKFHSSDYLTETFLEINNSLQNIKEQDSLINVFMNLTLKKFKFDRVSIFLLDENNELLFGKCILEKGEEYIIEKKPELPSFDNDYLSLKNTVGFWFLLKTNTRVVGAILFDNIYSLHKISEKAVDILRILCSYFASAIENIRLFSDLQMAALQDKLTGLHNRRYFENVVDDYRERDLNYALIIGDVNGLKVTNDVFGHHAGDKLLKAVANIICDCTSPQDIIVRWGGDEFVVLLPDNDKNKAEEICKNIKEKCSNFKESKIDISIALGTATRKSIDDDLITVLKRAEDRMYHNKLRETKEFRDSLITSLMNTLGEKGAESSGHAERMADLALKLGQKMNLARHELRDLKMLAMLHDIGKVSVPRDILNKRGVLTKEEWEEVRKHSEAGYRIAHESFEFSPIANYILYHHERWDGQGYPLGLAGTDIPLLSRIIAVIDAYDVMTHHQGYKEAISHQEAVVELKSNAGTQFDPEIVEEFLQLEF
ncbi:MAG: HD domain-containing phosphohydrolase, partial [bacterium]